MLAFQFEQRLQQSTAAPCSGGLETTSGASFVDACAEAVLSPEVLPNLSDCNQQKHVGLVVEFFLELADSAKPVGSMG